MLEKIKENFERLIARYEAAVQESKSLRASLERSEAENEAYRKQIAELERQVDNLKLTQAFMTPCDASPEARQKVDKLIKEIDKCISLLEK